MNILFDPLPIPVSTYAERIGVKGITKSQEPYKCVCEKFHIRSKKIRVRK